ncbi:MAG: DUF2520 domain-containing protein [bacterium]|nr:DUF2520 domain-containing protein [bacterium]
MGQVPGRASLLLIGDGRLAGHLNHYFRAKKLPVTQWSRRYGVAGPGDPGASEARIAGRGDPWEALPGLVEEADRVLLAIRDDAIPGFVRAHRRDPGPVWVHFSGSVAVDGAWTAHPLSTFAGPPYELEVYEAIPFIVEREGPPLGELVPGLDNPWGAIPRADKPLYHALCVTAGNFTQLVWQQLFRSFEDRLGLASGFALPYLRQTCRSLEQGPGPELLTGPIARRDHDTVRRNLEALRAAGLTDLAGVYEAFLRLADTKPLEEAA